MRLVYILKAGGMGHSRARRLTTRLAAVISECRTALAKVRNQRAQEARAQERTERERLLNAKVSELHARDEGAAMTLEQLLGAARAVKEGYRRRRERAEREVELERQRQKEERLRVRQRRKRRRVMRGREARRSAVSGGKRRQRKGLGRDHGDAMVQPTIGEALRGEVSTEVQVNSDTDPESEGSSDEGKCRPRLDESIAARHAVDVADMQERAGRARAAAARRDQVRRGKARRGGRLRQRKGGQVYRRRVRQRAEIAAGARQGGGVSDGLEEGGANTNPDEDDTGSARESEVEEGADRGRMGRLSAVLGRRRRRWVVDDSDSGGEDGGEKGG